MRDHGVPLRSLTRWDLQNNAHCFNFDEAAK